MKKIIAYLERDISWEWNRNRMGCKVLAFVLLNHIKKKPKIRMLNPLFKWMKMNGESLFLLLYEGSIYKNMQQDKIELLACNSGSQNCKEHLLIINKCYIEANNYRQEKDYLNSIESLKSAFFRTTDLQKDSCIRCAEFFRSTITQSLENINGELQKLTTGLIRNNRYLSCYEKSCAVLNDLKKEL